MLCTFEDFALSEDTTDVTIWQTCQDYDILMITGNRHAEGHERWFDILIDPGAGQGRGREARLALTARP